MYSSRPSVDRHVLTIPIAPEADLDSIFEVPFDKCVSFRGRERLLETMETYFNQSSRGTPLVYALTGLGILLHLSCHQSLFG